jgi:hypothetical protein
MKRQPSLVRGFALAACVVCGTLVAGSAVFAAPHEPGGRKPKDCVTKLEYRQVEDGMTRSKVHRVIGTDGKRESFEHQGPHTTELRIYDGCNSPDSLVTITYEKDRGQPLRVSSKTAIWVE